MDTSSEPTPNESLPIELEPTQAPKQTSYANLALLILLPLLTFALGIGIGYLAWGKQAASPELIAQAIQATEAAGPAATTAARIAQDPPADMKWYDVPVDDDYIYGPEDAPITIIEFSDFQCPYCEKWYREVLQPLLEMYPGKIRFVYRDFPLFSIHPEALPAAIAANCAGEQGQYYPFHNALFEGKYGLGAASYPKYATDLKLDNEQFSACIETEKYRDEIMADYQWASELGVQSTPTFFVNGIPLVGAQPLETFQMVIEWGLAGKLPTGD